MQRQGHFFQGSAPPAADPAERTGVSRSPRNCGWHSVTLKKNRKAETAAFILAGEAPGEAR